MQEYKEQYYAGRERMNPDIERMITSNKTPLSDNPAFPKYDKNGMPINFIELVAYKRFLDCVNKVKYYTKLDNISGNQGMMQLQKMLMSAVKEVMDIESQHIPFLEKLAVEIVTKEMEIPNGTFLFDAKMVRLGEVDNSGFQQEEKKPSESEIEKQFGGDESMSADELFKLEKDKRRFINILIQGSAKKGHYMFELVRNKINQINPRLANLYGVIMSINDLTYWLMSDEMIDSIGKSSSGAMGKEEIDDTTIPPTIKATGVFHPTLVHEVIKGIMEVFGTHGLPDDEKSQQMIIQSVDIMPNEVWDIRVGAVCWEQFSKQYPFEIFEEGKRNVQHYLFARFCALDVDDFFESTPLILSSSPKGEKVIIEMVDDIERDMKKRALRDALPEDDDNGYEEEYGVGGSVDEEVSYINRRIRNLEGMLSTLNSDERQDVMSSIDSLKTEREGLLSRNSGISQKKSFWSFKKGGLTEMPKDKSRIHFTDDEGREYDGSYIESDNMFFIGFEDKGDFRYGFEITEWHYLDGTDDDDAHAKHEASETAKEEREEHEYDVYDNKRMLKNQAREVEHHSEELNNQIPSTEKVPAWLIAKMERATTDLSDVTHYLDGENTFADGGKVGDINYDIRPHRDKFIVVQITYKQHEDYTYPLKEFIRGFNGKFLEFDDIKSAQKFIDKIEYKYPYGNQKANAGLILMASQLMQKQEPQQPQVVYYVPQQQEQQYSDRNSILQNIPQAEQGGEMDMSQVNDFCMTQLIELANELQPLRYFVTDRFSKEVYKKEYAGKLILVFKEPVSTSVVNTISNFIEKAKDCQRMFEQSVNVSGSEPNAITINILDENFVDREFGKGGKVYDDSPKKINLDKTKKITTILGDYYLGLITDDFVYYFNNYESDENAQTIMYNKKGELISDNYFATQDLMETLENKKDFEYIHPELENYRKQINQ
jgi:hypothetical protein